MFDDPSIRFIVLAVAVLTITFVGVVIVWRGVAGMLRARGMENRLEQAVGHGPIVSPLDDFDDSPGAIEEIGRRIASIGRNQDDTRLLLVRAGWFNPASVYTFNTARLFVSAAAAAGGFALFLFVDAIPARVPDWIGAVIGGSIGYLVPKMWLNGRVKARCKTISREMATMLDVLALVIESGLNVDQALRWLAELEGLNAPETQRVLRLTVRDIDSGMDWVEALDRMGTRLAIREASDLAIVLAQSITTGTDVRRPLKAFAEEFRDSRYQTAREQIGRKTTSLSVIMVVFFLPVLLLLLGSPALVSLMRSLGGSGVGQ